jgi:hypothetical protein
MWYIYIKGLYLVVNKNEIMSFAGKWIEVEIILLNEISQFHKDKYHFFHIFGS